jgi:hypothetical protein
MDVKDALETLGAKLPEVDRIAKVNLRPGDVVVLEVKQRISHEVADRIKALAETIWPDNKVAVFDSEITVKVLERCTADIAMKRHARLREHMAFIKRGDSQIAPQVVATRALEDDVHFDDCVLGKHAFIEATHMGDMEPRYLWCAYCGAKPNGQERP